MRIAVATAVLAGLLLACEAHGAEAANPHEMIRATADRLLDAIKGRREALAGNPEALQGLVDEVLRPNFDLDYAGRLVMGRYWARSTPEQREAFTEALYGSLVRKYASGLLRYHEDMVRVLPHSGLIGPDEEFVTVRTEVETDDGVTVPVEYRMRWTGEGWKVFDVVIENLSYVSYFRQQIGEDIRNEGLDAVIEGLRHSGREAAAAS